MTIQLVSSNPEPNPSPFVWRRDWSFSYIKPDPNVFQRFGICGDCEVITRGGMVKIRDLTAAHQIITRSQGFVRPIGLLQNTDLDQGDEGTRRVGISAGALGGGLPQRFIVLGAQNELSRYVNVPNSRRISFVSLDLEGSENIDAIRNCAAGELFVPVFKGNVKISVAGVYISCPTISDLRAKTDTVSQ